MGTVLQIRVSAETFSEDEVRRKWPALWSLVWEDGGDAVPRKGVLELVQAVFNAVRAGLVDSDKAGAEDEKDNHLQYGAFIQKRGRKSTLGQTRIIVAAGRGIESQENLEKIQRLAACFSDASVAGSRPLIDMGWMPYANQVGITGAVVAPDLYLAMGISGSSQHIAGMAQSKFIVAVNKDPNAAIFNVSDICIVENTLEFIEKLISLARK